MCNQVKWSTTVKISSILWGLYISSSRNTIRCCYCSGCNNYENGALCATQKLSGQSGLAKNEAKKKRKNATETTITTPTHRNTQSGGQRETELRERARESNVFHCLFFPCVHVYIEC